MGKGISAINCEMLRMLFETVSEIVQRHDEMRGHLRAMDVSSQAADMLEIQMAALRYDVIDRVRAVMSGPSQQ